jgi:phage terminase large subunit-like protein
MSEVVLLLPNTDLLQQAEDYVRGCTTSTKYWPPLTSWRLCQRLYYFYQILTTFNRLKIMSEVVLLLPNTVCLQQAEDYVRGCTTSTKYCPSSTSWRLCQRLYYFYQILVVFNKLKIMSEVVLLLQYNLWHNLQLVKSGQYLVEVVQPLT